MLITIDDPHRPFTGVPFLAAYWGVEVLQRKFARLMSRSTRRTAPRDILQGSAVSSPCRVLRYATVRATDQGLARSESKPSTSRMRPGTRLSGYLGCRHGRYRGSGCS